MRIVALISAVTLIGSSAGVWAGEGPAPSVNPALPDATLQLNEGRLSNRVDYMWGRGRLQFGAGRHAFRISGAPLVDGDALTLSAVGKVYHLSRLSDFPGAYTAVNPESVSGADASGVPMRNEHGVGREKLVGPGPRVASHSVAIQQH